MAKKSRKKAKQVSPVGPDKPGQVQVYVPERFREGGAYSNIANISISDSELVISFVFADQQGASVVSKVILSHNHAKKFLDVFKKVLSKHNKSRSRRK